jgi:hypothetical protein
MKTLVRNVLALGFAASATTAAAQITFYDAPRFAGRSFTASRTISNLADVGFNDRAVSAVIRSGTWQLCTDAYFRGHCESLVPGEYADLSIVGIAGTVSSARELTGTPGADRGPGGRVVLYDGSGFRGRTFDVNDPVSNFDRTGFNDRARSMIVNEGTWELCADSNFGGPCQSFGPGRYSDLGPLTGRLSSMRPARGGGGWGGGWGGGSRAVLYEGPNFSGRQFVVDSQVVANLDGTGFNDRASSLRVEGGYWIFCSDANFGGECQTFGPGDYPRLTGGLNNRISSGRRVHSSYPYNQSPDWSGQR